MNPFESFDMNKTRLRNRLAMAPMTTYSGNPDHTPSEKELHYYALRSKDAGMVISAAVAINEQAYAFDNQIALENEGRIESLKPLAEAIKSDGAKAIAQLHHGGRMNEPHLYENQDDIVSASAVKAPREGKVTPRAMEIHEIKQTVQDFKDAARRAMEAGFDGVELHGANTYLLQQFVSPHTNKRTDEYGGTREKRMRFIREIAEETQEVIKAYGGILGYRFSPEEIEEDGLTMEDTLDLVETLKNYDFDYLHVSLRRYDQSSMREKRDETPLVLKIQSVLNKAIPLMASGGISSKDDAMRAIEMGFDLMSVGFSLIADPRAIDKMQKGLPVDKTIDASTMPRNLYNRLSKYKENFEKNGFRFSDF